MARSWGVSGQAEAQQAALRNAVRSAGPPAGDMVGPPPPVDDMLPPPPDPYTIGGGIGPRPAVPQRWTRPVPPPWLETGAPHDAALRRRAARQQGAQEFEDFKRRDLEEWRQRNPNPNFLEGYYHPEDAEATVVGGPSLQARQYHAQSQPPMVMEGHAAKMRRLMEMAGPYRGIRDSSVMIEPPDEIERAKAIRAEQARRLSQRQRFVNPAPGTRDFQR